MRSNLSHSAQILKHFSCEISPLRIFFKVKINQKQIILSCWSQVGPEAGDITENFSSHRVNSGDTSTKNVPFVV